MKDRKCEYRIPEHVGSICGKPGRNPCREHDVPQLSHELKISRDTIKAVTGLIAEMEARSLPFVQTIDKIKLVLANDGRAVDFSRDLFERMEAS